MNCISNIAGSYPNNSSNKTLRFIFFIFSDCMNIHLKAIAVQGNNNENDVLKQGLKFGYN